MENNNKVVTISKQKLAELPLATFEGEIVLIDTLAKADEAAELLAREKIIGFDTETKPSFKRGQNHNVALLQLATQRVAYLFRLNKIGIPESLKKILEDENIQKIGLSIHDDFINLNKKYRFSPAGFTDLQGFVKDYLILDNSLARIYAILFNLRISKGQRLTNWEAEELTNHQQGYAALDAYACIKIYDYLTSGKFEPFNSPYLYEQPKEEI